jgi:predicted RNA-binding protein
LEETDMSCNQRFDRCLQGKFDKLFRSEKRATSQEEVSAGPHRLIGTEIWGGTEGKEEILLEGVTGIEFHERKILFRTVLGESLLIQGEVVRLTLREGGVILEARGMAG